MSDASRRYPCDHRAMAEPPLRLSERGGALLEEAAERSRTSMRTRFERLALAWRSLLQTAVARFVDALIGGGIALLVNSLVLPADPLRMVRRAAEPVLDELALTLEAIAQAIEARDEEQAERALLRARDLDELEDRLREAVAVSRETARFAPVRRRDRGHVDLYADAAAQIDLAIRNVRVLARGAVRGARLGENVPPEVATAVRDLAEAVARLRDALAEP